MTPANRESAQLTHDAYPVCGRFALIAVGLFALLLGACSTRIDPSALPPHAADQQIEQLTGEITALDPGIDSGEARRAARVSIEYSLQLAQKYRVTGSPLFHNLLVNLGLRNRGLCIDWTEDLMARLQLEKFRSLDLHWAIANYQTSFRLEHSSVVVTAPGASIQQGLILDPWRNSGDLYWARADNDQGYLWHPRAEVHALKRSFEADLGSRMTR